MTNLVFLFVLTFPYTVCLLAFLSWWFKLTRPIRSFEIYSVGLYKINGEVIAVDQLVVPARVRETHARWKSRLIDYDRRAQLVDDRAAMDIEFMAMENQMRKEMMYFDHMCCLDVPDLVKAKVWGLL